MKGINILFVCFVLASCTSKVSKWQNQITACIASVDSTRYSLNTQIDSSALVDLLNDSKFKWERLKQQLMRDTLDKESLIVLDAFNTAYSNSKNLTEERNSCNVANNALKKRLLNLLDDIEHGNGDRSSYCASVQHEKEELTIIRNHAIDIHRRFEELKSSKTQFENDFSRYTLN